MNTDFSRVVLLHDEMLSPTNPTLTAHPDLPRVFVFDMGEDAQGRFALKRLQFIADGLAEIPDVLTYKGDTVAVLRGLGAQSVVTQNTPQRWLHARLSAFEVEWTPEPAFAEYRGALRRFTPYWKKVETALLTGKQNPAR
jgi:deoxyribodipyrimidine photo-lyase